MRVGLWALLALLLGALLAHFVLEDRGYVLITLRSYVVEMSVPGLLLTLVALYLVVRGIAALIRLPRSVRARSLERRTRRGGENLSAAFKHLIEGDTARAERLLTHGGAADGAPFVSYVLAARAAQAQGARARRDEWLALAYGADADSQPAVLLAQAELELDAGEPDAALATLERLEQRRPDHPGAVALLARVHRARHDAAGLNALLPRLARAHMSAQVRDALAADALRIELALPDLGSERLDELWAEVGAELRASPTVLALHARARSRVSAADRRPSASSARRSTRAGARISCSATVRWKAPTARSSSNRPRVGSRLIARTPRCCSRRRASASRRSSGAKRATISSRASRSPRPPPPTPSTASCSPTSTSPSALRMRSAAVSRSQARARAKR